MALIKCGECGSKISDKATACPSCGAPPTVKESPTVAKKSSGGGSALAFVIVGVIVFGFIASSLSDCSGDKARQAEQAKQQEQQQTKKQLAAEAQQKKLDDFRANPAPTLALAQALTDQQDWWKVVKLLKPYLPANNAEARRMHDDAFEKHLVGVVAKIPASDVKGNYDTYNRLATLRPQNRTYVAKRDLYKTKRDELQAKELAEKLLFGNPPISSSWDGTYSEVKTYLKQVANDPDSIEMVGCTKVYKKEDGWLVGCQYRGTNGFGGKILTGNWFRIQRGNVVEMYDHDQFAWPGA